MSVARTRDALPAAERAALEALFGDAVDDVEIVERSWYARLHFGARATTRRNRILLRGTIADFRADRALLLHEYFQWNRGRMSLRSYLAEWLRSGYWRNRYERQARRFVHLRLAAFERLLSG
jgi:Domain of unknown function (DUF4157)